ncbi:transglycosylase SLT domain-containing protein [Fuchsiella alkaliacetigena]|uniref:transglycosylase SLT domain-containing protein n=1 Tax=Fuchsiella alkaliacetigena TaxID=957042 RepID=UPI00200A669F|nr:transglycosylase SLT domain-containing protein [Fuchsiella alkaliacetigena]
MRRIVFLVVIFLLIPISVQAQEAYIADRIYYVHDKAYNTSISLSRTRASQYAQSILKWSEEYNVDPFLVLAILEAETNFVSRGDYDEGRSIGIGSMKRYLAKDLAAELGLEYSEWRMLDPLELGIRLPVYYLSKLIDRFGDIHQVIVAYNRGPNSGIEDEDAFYLDYLFRVLGRKNYYQEALR